MAAVLQSARARKFVGLLVILGFMAVYVWAAIAIGDYVPDHWAAKLAYFATAGMAWSLPLKPLFGWMNRGR